MSERIPGILSDNIMSKIVLKNKESLSGYDDPGDRCYQISNIRILVTWGFHYQMRIIYTCTICHPPSHVVPATLLINHQKENSRHQLWPTQARQALKYIY